MMGEKDEWIKKCEGRREEGEEMGKEGVRGGDREIRERKGQRRGVKGIERRLNKEGRVEEGKNIEKGKEVIRNEGIYRKKGIKEGMERRKKDRKQKMGRKRR